MRPGIGITCWHRNDPDHLDLVGSNRGRNLVYSIWSRDSDTWSPPRPVLEKPDDFQSLPIHLLDGD